MRKLLSTVIAAGLFVSTAIVPAFADVAFDALPVLNGADNANITTSGANMNVQINGGQGSVGTINWGSFNVGKDSTVNYEFTAHNQTALNKVDAAGGLSQIYGKITNSGCAGCTYAGTGKIILLNPNGVFFGSGANVDVNSFTVSTMDGTFNKETNQLELNRTSSSPYGILVEGGAKIHGDKNVTFASDKVTLYNGSKISTNIGPNVGNDSFGKVKIVTADGVNFAYYNNGAVKNVNGVVGATEKMVISADGATIDAGQIDIRNYSSNVDSQINLNGAVLKATKAVSGNDGNIWLTASNKVVIDGSTLTTKNYSDGAAANEGGDISILAGEKVSIKNSNLNAVRDVEAISQKGDSVIDSSIVKAGKDIRVTAGKIAAVQNGSNVAAANDINVNGKTRTQILKSEMSADQDINVVSDGEMLWNDDSTLTAGRDVNLKANNGYLLLQDSLLAAGRDVNLLSKDNISSTKLTGSSFEAQRNVNVESTQENVLLSSTSQFKPVEDLNLKAAKNIELTSASDLTPQKMNLTAGKDIKLTSTEGNLTLGDNVKFLAAEKIYLSGAKNVTTSSTVDLNNIQTNIVAGDDVNVSLSNVGNRQNGLIAKAGNDMTVSTDGTLSVSSLISGNNMTINANKVIAGLPYTDEEKLNDDFERSYIEVGGEFTSNVANDNYEITLSGDPTNDGKYNQRHHIQYGEDEKILLVNKRIRPVDPTDPNLPDNNSGDEADVINPGDVPDDQPQVPTDPTDPTDPPTEPTDPTDPTDPDEGDCDGDPEYGDVIEGEDSPSIDPQADLRSSVKSSLVNLSNYMVKLNTKKSL